MIIIPMNYSKEKDDILKKNEERFNIVKNKMLDKKYIEESISMLEKNINENDFLNIKNIFQELFYENINDSLISLFIKNIHTLNDMDYFIYKFKKDYEKKGTNGFTNIALSLVLELKQNKI